MPYPVIINQPDVFGMLWTIAWLFSIGYFQLTFWQGFFAIVIWPYYWGVKFHNANKKAE